MSKKKLTIIGATGFLSTSITRQLVEDGVDVCVIARNPEKAKQVLPDSVTILRGDVADEENLISAFVGTETLYIHLNTETTDMDLEFYTEREGVQNIVNAAKANGVKHIMQIAGMESLREDFFLNGALETKRIREQGMEYIKESGIPYTFFFCSFFVDSFIRFVEDNMLFVFGELPHEVYFTNSLQLAGHIHLAIDNDTALNKQYAIQGKESSTFEQAALEFFRAYNSDVAVQKVPIATIDELGLPSGDAAFLKHVWEICDGFQEEFVANDTYRDLGEPLMDINQCARSLKNNT